MHKSISSISNGSEQLSLTTQMLSEGSSDQSGAVEELLASFTEILEQVKKNTESADEVRNLAQQSGEAVKNISIIIGNSLSAVANGENLTKETAASLNIIVKNVDGTRNIYSL